LISQPSFVELLRVKLDSRGRTCGYYCSCFLLGGSVWEPLVITGREAGDTCAKCVDDLELATCIILLITSDTGVVYSGTQVSAVLLLLRVGGQYAAGIIICTLRSLINCLFHEREENVTNIVSLSKDLESGTVYRLNCKSQTLLWTLSRIDWTLLF